MLASKGTEAQVRSRLLKPPQLRRPSPDPPGYMHSRPPRWGRRRTGWGGVGVVGGCPTRWDNRAGPDASHAPTRPPSTVATATVSPGQQAALGRAALNLPEGRGRGRGRRQGPGKPPHSSRPTAGGPYSQADAPLQGPRREQMWKQAWERSPGLRHPADTDAGVTPAFSGPPRGRGSSLSLVGALCVSSGCYKAPLATSGSFTGRAAAAPEQHLLV